MNVSSLPTLLCLLFGVFTIAYSHNDTATAGQVYYAANSILRNSSHLPNGYPWSSVLNQTHPNYPQLHYFCERMVTFDIYANLTTLSSDVEKLNRYMNLTMKSICHLLVSSKDIVAIKCKRLPLSLLSGMLLTFKRRLCYFP